jgi:mono/diheme cytochrome c family protein
MRKTILIVLTVIVTGALLLAACGGGESEQPVGGGADRPAVPAPYSGKKNPRASAADEGRQIYNINCASCHGETGRGDGPASAALDPKPQDLSTTVSSLGDDYLLWRISEGGMMEPFKSVMPAWKATLSEDQIWAVVAYLRTLAQ